jgi:hypothetical protein
MSENKNDDFLSKFADRVEKVGRDGVMGLMKSTGSPINSISQNNYEFSEFSSTAGKNRLNEVHKNILDYENSPFGSNNQNNLYMNNNSNRFSIKNNYNYSNINNNNNDYKLRSANPILPPIKNGQFNQIRDNENMNNNLRNPLLYSFNTKSNSNLLSNKNNNGYFYSRSNVRNNSVSQRYYANKNNNNLFDSPINNSIAQRNINSVANNRQNIVDYGYTPYTLKDYKKITNDVKLGKLGPNIGTEEWKQKRRKMKKMSEYGNKVMHEGKGCYVKISESPDERHKRLQEMKQLNGKWNIINEYSKGLLLNNDRKSNEQFKRNVNNKLMEEERLVDQQFEFDMEKEEEEERILQQKKNAIYQQRLNRMKNLLFK